MSEWISVKDRLPTLDHDIVLAWDAIEGDMCMARFKRREEYWDFSDLDGDPFPATHWTPLPDPPK